MARSKVSVMNKALTKVAAARITSENEVNERGTEVRSAWDDILEEVLGAYNWNFAARRQALAQITTAPVYGYEYAYRLPTNPKCIKVREMDEGKEWIIEGDDSGGLLLTDYATCYIRFTGLVSNPDLWSGWFTEVFATRLAAEICLPLRNSRTLKDSLLAEYEYKLEQAGVTDAQESGDETADDERHPATHDWVAARHGDIGRIEGDV
jgi:hypothetical protein